MTERACVFDDTFPKAVSDLMQGCTQVISLFEENPNSTSITESELTTLYNIISKLVSQSSVDPQIRLQIFQWALQRNM